MSEEMLIQQDACQLSGKGEFKVMNFNRDDNTPVRFTPGREDKFGAENRDVGTRPAGDPKSTKNFQKVLSKDKDDKEKEGEASAVDGEEGVQSAMILAEEKILKDKSLKKHAPASLFELSSHGSKSSAKMDESKLELINDHAENKLIADAKIASQSTHEQIDESPVKSPADLYAKITTKEPKKIEVNIEQVTDKPVIDQPIKTEEKKDKFNSRFATEQTDLSYVNPLALNTQSIQQTTPIAAEKPALPSINIQDIIDQLVEKVVQMETNDRTETIITLKRPPVLAGADLIVTGFDSAKGEFNITFQKLTQAAKTLLDMRVNQQSLLLALEQKGYAVHIVTTTTLAEINLPTAQGSTPQGRNQNQGQQREGGQQQQQPDRQR